MRVSPQNFDLTHILLRPDLCQSDGEVRNLYTGSFRSNLLFMLSCLAGSESVATPMLWTDSLIGAHTDTERSARAQIQTAFYKRGLEDNLLAPSAVGAQW